MSGFSFFRNKQCMKFRFNARKLFLNRRQTRSRSKFPSGSLWETLKFVLADRKKGAIVIIARGSCVGPPREKEGSISLKVVYHCSNCLRAHFRGEK